MPAPRRPALVPQPTHLSVRPGHFALGAGTAVRVSPGAAPAADLLRTLLAPATGLPLPPSPDGRFVLALDPQLGGLGAEGYGLTVGPDAVLLRAARLDGLLRGVQTLRQLLPVEALSGGPRPGTPWRLPCVEITDVPRHAWRGFMLDVARHFQPVALLRRYVDLLALHKLNVLHLHLTDDQGWRMPVAAYPRLTEVSSKRAESMVSLAGSGVFDGTPHHGAYTRAELTGLVTYAAARGVTLVPETEMPGHVRAALAAYPELGNAPGRKLDVWTGWGVCDTVLGVGDPGARLLPHRPRRGHRRLPLAPCAHRRRRVPHRGVGGEPGRPCEGRRPRGSRTRPRCAAGSSAGSGRASSSGAASRRRGRRPARGCHPSSPS
ncbi:hypothetical protein SALBM135S_00578 [Streptomyces alboniger]